MSPNSAAEAATATNAEVIAAIKAHHAELAEQLRLRTEVVLHTARSGGIATPDRDALHRWYQTELIPHAVAEERTLYTAAEDVEATRLLVRGMLAEHRALVELIADLALARQAVDVAITASVARALFLVHLDKENDLLLPALDAAGVELAPLLAGMHELLGHAQPAADEHGGCGCGCGHDDAEGASGPVAVQIAPARDSGAELDVRVLPHGQRHEIIFGRLDALAPGQSLVIVNDHDPKPLRYQVSALWPDRFAWNYLESGPQTWRLAITRAA